jgi:MFS family permease
LGAIFFSIPHFRAGDYNPQPNAPEFILKQIGLCGRSQFPCQENDVKSSYMALFVIGQIMIGTGLAPLYCLVPAYIDENIKPKWMPIAVLMWYAILYIGPIIGMAAAGIFLQSYIDIDQVL